MTTPADRYLDTFPSWLTSLGADALEVARVLADDGAPTPVRALLAGSLNYLFKSLDLIPDGIEDLGFLDDTFVLRVAAENALTAGPGWAETPAASVVRRLAGETALLRDFLGAAYLRLERYTRELARGAARGRTTEDIVAKRDVCEAFVAEVHAWADAYEPPTFTRDERTLLKLTSFLEAKLPPA